MSEDGNVRQAARAVLRYAEGATQSEAVDGTPYGIGWIRPLIKLVRDDGPGALERRDYRAPRKG